MKQIFKTLIWKNYANMEVNLILSTSTHIFSFHSKKTFEIKIILVVAKLNCKFSYAQVYNWKFNFSSYFTPSTCFFYYHIKHLDMKVLCGLTNLKLHEQNNNWESNR